jgi:hypothetical protein
MESGADRKDLLSATYGPDLRRESSLFEAESRSFGRAQVMVQQMILCGAPSGKQLEVLPDRRF